MAAPSVEQRDMAGAGARAYEDFEPPHKMVHEPPTHTLSVDLSAKGYKKEHIKVQLFHSRRLLVVSGECPVASNRWSRFRLQFPVPNGCDVKAIQARLESGVVRVTLPGLKVHEPRSGRCQFLRERRKLTTTLVGVVLVLFSFVIYVRYSVKP